MSAHVDIELSDTSRVDMDAEMVSTSYEDSPPIMRLVLQNRTHDELRIRSGEPAPLGDNRSTTGPEHLEFQPTEETIRDHDFRMDSRPYRLGKIGAHLEDCWVVDDGYGPGRQIGVLTVVGPGERLVFEYAFVTIPSASECYPDGVYLFDHHVSFVERGKSVDDFDWEMELELTG